VKFIGLIIIVLLSTTTSSAFAEINTGIGHKMGSGSSAAPAPAQKAPPNHPMFQPPANPTAEGKVLDAIDGAGYTYLELEKDGKKYWIAGTQVTAKKGDKVKYDENVTMEKFFSKTLNRSFDRIIFASNVQVVK